MSDRSASAPSKKEESHRRILSEAAKLVRANGFQATGVAEVMKAAGLTHGGFYAHFESKDALLAEAVAASGQERLDVIREHLQAKPASDRLKSLALGYLANGQATPSAKCPVATLGSELPRQSEPVREAATRHVAEVIDLIAGLEDQAGQPLGKDRAAVTFSMLLGAAIISRAVTDPKLARSLVWAVTSTFA